jgi:hypothetical protein
MHTSRCDECRAIENELKTLLESARTAYERGLAGTSKGQEILDSLRAGDEEEFARLTETSSFSRIWQRAREHRTLTGHLKYWPWMRENAGPCRN